MTSDMLSTLICACSAASLATYVSNSLDRPKVEKMTYGSDFMYDFLEEQTEEEEKKVVEDVKNNNRKNSFNKSFFLFVYKNMI